MKTHFYLADDIQPLGEGKLLMVGVYPDHTVVVNFAKGAVNRPTKEKPAAMPSLTFGLTLLELQAGKRQAAPVLRLPSGEPHHTINPVDFDIKETRTVNLLFKLTPFVIPIDGVYTLELKVDEELLKFPVMFKFAEKQE